jgi:hypothetical protein
VTGEDRHLLVSVGINTIGRLRDTIGEPPTLPKEDDTLMALWREITIYGLAIDPRPIAIVEAFQRMCTERRIERSTSDGITH